MITELQLNRIHDTLSEWYDDHQAANIIHLIQDVVNDKHIVFTICNGYIEFLDTKGRSGKQPNWGGIDKTIETIKDSLAIDEQWTIEIID